MVIENKDDMPFKLEVKENIMYTKQSSVDLFISNEAPNVEEGKLKTNIFLLLKLFSWKFFYRTCLFQEMLTVSC